MKKRLSKQISKNSGSNFYATFLFLNKNQRKAMQTVYSFCRLSDDIVDSNHSQSHKTEELTAWRNSLENCFQNQFDNQLFSELKQTIDQFAIPHDYFREIIAGMEMDLTQNEYNEFSDLYKYCYRVASVVGLISIYIFGNTSNDAQEYAINLGIALQLTNIMRDFHQDARENRVYIPAIEMHDCSYSTSDLLAKVNNGNYQKLMTQQFERALMYYKKSQEVFAKTTDRRLRVAQMMGAIYYRILLSLKASNFYVFDHKISLSTYQKIWAMLSQIRLHRFI
ncbi:MAG: squalene/phytoene synthase family protein [Calditrichaeota bacterium]|nr:squalene/phytoene synthase family protein [Calditrichota bacterium]